MSQLKNYRLVKNLESTLAKGEERQRLTKQLGELVIEICDQIKDEIYELGGILKTANRTYVTKTYATNVGPSLEFGVKKEIDSDGYGLEQSFSFELLTRSPGWEGYIASDFSCPAKATDSDEFLEFVNNLPEILNSLEEKQDQAINNLKKGFEKLRKIAEV